MASTQPCLAPMARLSLSTVKRPSATTIPAFLIPAIPQLRHASVRGQLRDRNKKKKKLYKTFRTNELNRLEKYSLCDALRYLRAFEVGRPPTSVKYEIAVKLGTIKNAPNVKSRIRLPHPVKTNIRVAVIAKDGSNAAQAAREAGAAIVGEESLLEDIKQGNMDFERLLCHSESEAALNSAKLGRVLGPKGLMPSTKRGTITPDIARMMREYTGAEDFKEKMGVIRMGIGTLSFTPQMVADNVKAFMEQVKKDIGRIEHLVNKDMQEVVLSSTNGPGFSLDGSFKPTDEKITTEQLSSAV